MRKLLVLLMFVLLIGCTSKGVEVADKIRQYEGGPEPVVSAPVEAPEVEEEDPVEKSVEEEKPAEEDPTAWEPEEQEHTGEWECIVDSKGVVRVTEPDGSKKVFRDDCQPNGIVIKYACEDDYVSDTATICSSGQCRPGPYGDVCVL